MRKVQKDIQAGLSKAFISAICRKDNDLVLEYLKNGMSATKEAMGMLPIVYAINNDNFTAVLLLVKYGAKIEKNYIRYEEGSNKEALKFLASLI